MDNLLAPYDHGLIPSFTQGIIRRYFFYTLVRFKMPLSSAIAKIEKEFTGFVEIVRAPVGVPLSSLLRQLSDIDTTSDALAPELRAVSPAEAHTLLTSSLHKGMAYSFEHMPVAKAAALSSSFIEALGKDAQFFSTTCVPDNPTETVGGGYFIVSTHTFESLLYCKGKESTVLVLVIDED